MYLVFISFFIKLFFKIINNNLNNKNLFNLKLIYFFYKILINLFSNFLKLIKLNS